MKAHFIVPLVLAASVAAAQQPKTTVVAHVLDVRDGAFVAAAEVSILDTQLRGRSDSLGRVAIAGVPAGSFSIEARRLGYKPVVTQLMVSGSDSLEVVLAMSPIAQALAGVKVTETAARIHLREFDERLHNHIGGFFITDSVIRRAEAGRISELLEARVPGIRPAVRPDGKIFIYSTRGASIDRKGLEAPCFVEVFLDGTRMLDGDVGVVPLLDLAGIEYYPPGYAPVQYRIAPSLGGDGSGAKCGVLLLWTRP